MKLPCDAIRQALNDDFEFRHAARYLDASLRLGIGEQPLCVRIAQGHVEELRPWRSDDPADVAIDASTEAWEKLLAAEPRPFYQSLFAAAEHHGVSLSGDPLTSFVYMAALTRMLDVMREQLDLR